MKKTIPVFLISLLFLVPMALAGNQAHTETTPTPISAELKENFIGETDFSRYGQNMGFNLYLNFQLEARGRNIDLSDQRPPETQYSYYPSWSRSYRSGGYNVKTDEMVCVGEKLYVNQFSAQGEYFEKGGPTDSPPVRYVENLDSVKSQIETRTYTTNTERILICQWAEEDEREIGPQRCVIDGAVLCSNSCLLDAGENLRETGEGEYEVVGAGAVDFTASCTPECIVFVDRKEGTYVYPEREWEEGMINEVDLKPVYGYMELKDPQGKELLLSKTYSMTAGEGYGPKFEVKEINIPDEVGVGSEFVVRLGIENTGDMKASLDNIGLNIPGSILYKPKYLEEGEKSEVLIKTSAVDAADLQLSMDYSSEHLSCMNTKEYSQTLSIGALGTVAGSKGCSTDADCSVGEACCSGSCRDVSKGVCDDIDGDGEPETWVEI